MIDEGALDQASTSDLAERLGLTDRHLRRLFSSTSGFRRWWWRNTPDTICKRLITEPICVFGIAFAAGFSSLRRFNEALPTLPKESQRTSQDDAA